MSPRVIGANLVVSIKSFSREKSAMFFTIALPIILILVFGTIFLNQDNMSFTLYVQDLDQTNASAQLVKMLDASPNSPKANSSVCVSLLTPKSPSWSSAR